ncbi:MAG TPA: SAM-dependent methyltransferase [Candidatus Limnocylindrales bacterium]|nr:SAM-dependent methyltransferase [Candidatus Limnocylindrales bacterium]
MTTLPEALAEIREALLAPGLIHGEGRGRRRDAAPSVVKATVRPVVLKSGPMLQIVTDDGQRPTTRNVNGPAEIDKLLEEPFGSWVVASETGTISLQTTRKGAIIHRGAPPAGGQAQQAHDREKKHLLDPGDPLFAAVEADARKRRQVDAFLRQLDVDQLPRSPHIVDLGCGNAYLTFAAYSYLSGLGFDVRVTGVDVREDQRRRNTELASRLGWAQRVRFIAGDIADVKIEPLPDMVFALHACDTATDDALARAIEWEAGWILAAPCCHKDISRQLRQGPQHLLTAHGIMRERFADVLTDVIRSGMLRERGYDVEVLEFIDSKHTPRNAMIRARRTGRRVSDPELAELVREWGINPALRQRLPATR